MTDKNKPEQGETPPSKPNITGFMTPEEMGLNYGSDGKPVVKEEIHLEEHFNERMVSLEYPIMRVIRQVLEYGARKIAPDYTIEIIRDQLDRPSYSNECYPCTVIKIKETKDQYKIGTKTFKYIGNGHKEISEPSKHLFEQIIKRRNELSNLAENEIPRFADSILEKILKETSKGECAPCETDFFADLFTFAEQALEGRTIGGMSAKDEASVKGDYWEGESKSAEIMISKSDPRFSRLLHEDGLEIVKGAAHGPEIINAIAEQDYAQASLLNERYMKKFDKGYQLVKKTISKYQSNPKCLTNLIKK